MQYANFYNFFLGSMLPDPLESFLALKFFKINSAGKIRLKKWQNWCLFPEKSSEYALDMKHFQKAYLRPFPSLNVFAFS